MQQSTVIDYQFVVATCITYTMSELGDQAWRYLRGAAGKLCSLTKPAVVSLTARPRPPTHSLCGVAGGFGLKFMA